MKHISNYPFRGGSVLITGKGPTFRAYDLPATSQIFAINQSAIPLIEKGILPDLVVCNDIEPAREVERYAIKKEVSLRFALPSFPHEELRPVTYYKNALSSDVYHFDLWTAPNRCFSDHSRFLGVCTSYGSALLIADLLNITTIVTLGIGGTGYAAPFGFRPGVNYDAQDSIEAPLRLAGVSITRL